MMFLLQWRSDNDGVDHSRDDNVVAAVSNNDDGDCLVYQIVLIMMTVMVFQTAVMTFGVKHTDKLQACHCQSSCVFLLSLLFSQKVNPAVEPEMKI